MQTYLIANRGVKSIADTNHNSKCSRRIWHAGIDAQGLVHLETRNNVGGGIERVPEARSVSRAAPRRQRIQGHTTVRLGCGNRHGGPLRESVKTIVAVSVGRKTIWQSGWKSCGPFTAWSIHCLVSLPELISLRLQDLSGFGGPSTRVFHSPSSYLSASASLLLHDFSPWWQTQASL